MLHALASEKKQSFMSSALPQLKRKLFAPPVPSFSNQSRLQMLQRKPDCACAGKCDDCKGKAESFYGDLDEGIEKQMPGADLPSVTTYQTTPEPMDKGDKPKTPSCGDICDRAYEDSSLNTGGGGVVCDGAKKCACVFDVPPLTRGQCADFDKVVMTHEKKHVSENTSKCDPARGLHRAKVRDPSKLTEAECRHRKASIKDLDKVIPKNEGDCKSGMETIRDLLDTWVKANC